MSLSLQVKGFDCVKNAQEIGKVALYLDMLKGFIRDVVADMKNETVTNRHELENQKETLNEIKKQNEEIIKLLNNGR